MYIQLQSPLSHFVLYQTTTTLCSGILNQTYCGKTDTHESQRPQQCIYIYIWRIYRLTIKRFFCIKTPLVESRRNP